MKAITKLKLLIIVFFLISLSFTAIYALDSVIMPTVMVTCDAEMKAKATEIINKAIFEEYSNNFNYGEIINVEKDGEGNISMIRTDTLKMNKIATGVALNAQEEIRRIGEVGIRLPFGYLAKNNILAYYGPKVTVRMQPIGHIETKYISKFETAGINQTRHKIYLEAKTKIKVIIPMASSDMEIVNQVPIAETIIVGKVPQTSLQMDLNKDLLQNETIGQ
ncbi:sporulation protein YunB [Clostridium sp. UBA4548]|uniref:sporulation protein YunB n=1 Tax=Clostridium sp. UBA4548 TaxID=1946361 RepID=UPI0025C445CE|nr:sporulation protein YunB [Clostridium sp. UBA4548]